jgi:hypothetical protein
VQNSNLNYVIEEVETMKWLANKSIFVLLVFLLFMVTIGCGRHTAQPAATSSENGERIGIYDSRSVAVAFVDSEYHKKWVSEIKERHDQAVSDGNTELVDKLNKEGAQRQNDFHAMGFSTAPVDELLERIEDKLPAIKEKAGVEILISKWDEKQLAEHPGAKKIDVTIDLVDAFNPSERQRRSALQIQKHKPISLKKARNLHE